MATVRAPLIGPAVAAGLPAGGAPGYADVVAIDPSGVGDPAIGRRDPAGLPV